MMQEEYLVKGPWHSKIGSKTKTRSRFVGRGERWKSLVLNRIMYGAGTLTWYEKECDELEIMQRDR